MHASQLDDVKTLLRIVDTAPQILRDEMTGQYSGIIAVCRFIISEEVTAVSDAFVADLAQLRADFHTLVTYQTWRAPGDDIPCVITTDDEGLLTEKSTLTVGDIHAARLIVGERDVRRYAGRPTTKSLAMISRVLIGMELGIWVDLSAGTDALTAMLDDEGTITGYSFTARHRHSA